MPTDFRQAVSVRRSIPFALLRNKESLPRRQAFCYYTTDWGKRPLHRKRANALLLQVTMFDGGVRLLSPDTGPKGPLQQKKGECTSFAGDNVLSAVQISYSRNLAHGVRLLSPDTGPKGPLRQKKGERTSFAGDNVLSAVQISRLSKFGLRREVIIPHPRPPAAHLLETAPAKGRNAWFNVLSAVQISSFEIWSTA